MNIDTCFVAMGYGIRRDYATNRYINMDLTYNKIIKPAMEEVGVSCIRNDETIFPGSFEIEMYKHLRDDDLVIVDISTLNPNALFELGVRYALRPYSTVVISEVGTKVPANITIIQRLSYVHCEHRITDDEISKMKDGLKELVIYLRKNKPEVDSPIHRVLNAQTCSSMSGPSLKEMVEDADQKYNMGNFAESEALYRQILDMGYNVEILKKLAVSIYKQNESDSKVLEKSLNEIAKYGDIGLETDSNLLSTCGAIFKKKWQITGNMSDLEKCKEYLEKSYYSNKSYYSGVNYAFSLICMASALKSDTDKKAYFEWGVKMYRDVKDLCLKEESDGDYWVCATIAECCLAIGEEESENEYYKKASKIIKDGWQREITDKQMSDLRRYIKELKK